MPIEVTRLIVKATLLEPQADSAPPPAVAAEDIRQQNPVKYQLL